MTTNDLVKINKDYFVKVAGVAAKTAIFAALPYLNIPPLNYFISKLVDWIITKISDALELMAFFTFVDMRVDQQGKDFVDASHLANTTPTEENLRKADEAFKAFAHLNNY